MHDQKHSSKEGKEDEEGLMVVETGGLTKTEGEEGSSSPHPTRNCQNFPAC